ncbi:CAP domain-containing protein [Paracoccaceae bacterium GXU_MW_L88]
MRFTICALAALALWGCAPKDVPFPDDTAPTTPATSTELTKSNPDAQRFTALVLKETNKARRAAGLSPLSADGKLARAAQMQARNMARDRRMNHNTTARSERTPQQRMDKVGLNGHFAENIAKNFVYDMRGKPVITRNEPQCRLEFVGGGAVAAHSYESMARTVVAQWMRSPGHRKNIMNPTYRRMGAGFQPQTQAEFCGDVYLAQTFSN